MLLPSAVEASLSFASNHGKDLWCNWVPANSWKICSQHGECLHDGSNSLIVTATYAFPESNHVCKRRKIHDKFLLTSAIEHETDEASSDTINSGPVETYMGHAVIDGVQAPASSVQRCKKDSCSIDDSVDTQLLPPSLDKDAGCSSLNVENKVGSTASRIEATNNKECANTNLLTLGKHLSARDLCLYVLRSCGLLGGDRSISYASSRIAGNNESNILQYCYLCGIFDNTLNMLLCDHCEGSFHLSCCYPKIKALPVDGWFCQFCSKLDEKVSLEASFLKSLKVSCSNGLAKFKSSPIASMLKYPEPYASRVKIGNSFQAAVPLWSDQISKDSDCIDEPLEMDPVETISLHGSSKDKHLKPSSLSNWLRCREVFHDGIVECGKWRRAPLSEVQTDDWDCSCAVLWDPSHSDCAVPQELETDEILLQLKYIDQLRSRPAAKSSW